LAEIERAMDGDATVVIGVVGELDLADEARMDLAVDFVVGLRIPNVVLDLSRCEFVDATGLRMLLRAQHRIDRSGATLAVLSPLPRVRRVMDITGVSDRLPMVDGREPGPAASGRPVSGKA
jgi:anti-sigma B factor antagonist